MRRFVDEKEIVVLKQNQIGKCLFFQ
jgi:hypothetical protein